MTDDTWVLERTLSLEPTGSVHLEYLSPNLDEYKLLTYSCSGCGGYDKYYTLWDDDDELIAEDTLDPCLIAKVLCYDCSGSFRGSCVKRGYVVYTSPDE